MQAAREIQAGSANQIKKGSLQMLDDQKKSGRKIGANGALACTLIVDEVIKSLK